MTTLADVINVRGPLRASFHVTAPLKLKVKAIDDIGGDSSATDYFDGEGLMSTLVFTLPSSTNWRSSLSVNLESLFNGAMLPF